MRHTNTSKNPATSVFLLTDDQRRGSIYFMPRRSRPRRITPIYLMLFVLASVFLTYAVVRVFA